MPEPLSRSRDVLEFGDEQGVELFYSAAATRWLRFGANLQVIVPAGSDRGTLVVGGIRANVVF